jgi:type IV secretion system protein VirB9
MHASIAIAGLSCLLVVPHGSVTAARDRQTATARVNDQIKAPNVPATSRTVRYAQKDVIPLYGEIRFTTLIVLPQDERILDFVCGDKDFWVVSGNQNVAYVKPAKAGARTNLNLITASGNVYSFVLIEASDVHDQAIDLKVYVELEEPSMIAAAGGKPAFVSAQQVEDFRAQVDLAKDDARNAAARADEAIAAFRAHYPTSLRFGYRIATNEKPFLVTAMYHDDQFTYIQARTTEPPTLYEIKDGRPSLVDYAFKDGVYVVGKILDQGYLAIGTKRLPFSRAE